MTKSDKALEDAYRRARAAVAQAYQQGRQGQPMTGDALMFHEFSQDDIKQGLYCTDSFYIEYQRGWSDRARND